MTQPSIVSAEINGHGIEVWSGVGGDALLVHTTGADRDLSGHYRYFDEIQDAREWIATISEGESGVVGLSKVLGALGVEGFLESSN